MSNFSELIPSNYLEGIDKNIGNLSKGMSVANYYKMCELLGENVRTGRSKQLQLANWSRYFEYKRQGHKFIITKILETPVPKIDKRGYSRSDYTKYIELLIMKFLNDNDIDVIRDSKSVMLKMFGMLSPTFIAIQSSMNNDSDVEIATINKDNQKACQYTIKKGDTWVFFQRVYKKASDMFEAALKSMQNRNIIEYSKTFNIVEKYSSTEEREVVYVPSEDGKKIEAQLRKNKPPVNTSKEEDQIIRDTENLVVEEMGYAKIGAVYCANKYYEFHQRVVEKLEEQYGWLDYFPQIEIARSEKKYEDNPYRTQDEEIISMSVAQLIFNLNKEVVDAFKVQSARQFGNAVKKDNEEIEKYIDHGDGWGENIMRIDMIKMNGRVEHLGTHYIEIQNCLADYAMPITKKQSKKLEEILTTGNFINSFNYNRIFEARSRFEEKKKRGRKKKTEINQEGGSHD